MSANPHMASPPLFHGASPDNARLGVVAVHGRDQSPEWIVENLARPAGLDDVAWLAPRAAESSWYPGRYHDPPAEHEPWLGWSLEAIDAAVDLLVVSGISVERIALAGFSQGACLVSELLARRYRPFRAAAILTGCLFGPGHDVTPIAASLDGLPVLMAAGRDDEWVDEEHIRDTAQALAAAGAAVDLRLRDEPEHEITPGDVEAVRALLVDRS